MKQLTTDGREVEYERTIKKITPLTDLQQEVLRVLDARGYIRSVEAGKMVHTARGLYPSGLRRCGFGNKGNQYVVHLKDGTAVPHKPSRGLGCCPYAATDGNEMMKRLMARGIVRRERPGKWVRVNLDG